MGGVGNDNFVPLYVASCFMIGFNQQKTSKFSMGTGCWLEGDRIHTGRFAQIRFSCIQHLLTASHRIFRLQRMNIGKPGQRCHFLINSRIILHRTRAQWIKSIVHTMCPFG